jgi:putative Ca2+/H+ antiporter (TMEM165/GDT1 family)
VFLAELGDKTQLVALMFATRFKAGTVLAGVFVATLLVHAFSVALGELAGRLLPHGWIMILSGLAFVGFAIWTWRGDKLDNGNKQLRGITSPFMIVAVTFFLAELGDKTMLSTVTLATQYPPVAVWLGSTLGMVLSDALAIGVGNVMGTRLPQKTVKIGAAAIFLAFGLFSLFQGVIELRQT